MYLLVLIKLCFYLLFYNRMVSSSQHLFSRNETIFSDTFDNILQKFFVDLKNVYLEKYRPPRHVAVIGASNEDLQQIQPLFESYPYSICKGLKRCGFSQRFIQRSLIFVFLADPSKKIFGKNTDILSFCKRCNVIFISNEMFEVNDIRVILTSALQHNVRYSKFARLEKNSIELYSDFIATNCTMEIGLVSVWRPGVDSENINRWAHQTRNMNKCPVSVSSLTFDPKMVITENENGTLTVVGGREGKLLLTIAEKLNFTINLRYPSIENILNYSRKVAIINDVASGISEIGIGRLRPTNQFQDETVISIPYDNECQTWSVPRIMKWSNNIIWVEFSWEVWLLIALVFAFGCIIAYAHRNIAMSKIGKRTSLIRSVTIFLDAISLHLGNPVLYVPSGTGGKFMLIAYLCYAMVITTAYKTSLASILATDQATPTITDVQGIINSGIGVKGSFYDYNILRDQANDSELTATILKLFVINNDVSNIWDREATCHDYAIMSRRSFLDYDRQMMIKSHQPITYDVLDDCILSHPISMVFQKRSFLRRPTDNVIVHLIEAGLMLYWDSEGLKSGMQSEPKMTEKYFEKRAGNVYKFLYIFIFYSICIFVSLFTFLIELLVSKLY